MTEPIENPAPPSDPSEPRPGSGDDLPDVVHSEQLAQLEKRLQDQSAMIGRQNTQIKALFEKLQSRVNDPEPPAPDKDRPSDPSNPIAQDFKVLRSELDRMKGVARKASLEKAMLSSGIDPTALEDAATLFLARHADAMQEDDAGQIVGVGDASLEDYLQSWTRHAGSRFCPIRKNPSSDDSGSTTGGGRTGGLSQITTFSELNALSDEQAKKLGSA